MKWLVILLGILLMESGSVIADTLPSFRDTEITRLTVCPEQPTVAVIGRGANLVMDKLLHHPGFRNHYQIMDKSSIAEESSVRCPQASANSNNASFTPQLFAMYFLGVDYAPEVNGSNEIHLQAIRSDTGDVVFDHKGVLGANFFALTIPKLVEALALHPFACRNKFTATVTENINLRCRGTMPGRSSRFDVSSDLRMIFNINSFDFDGHASDQTVSGTAELLPAKALTELSLAVSQNGSQCKGNLVSHRKITIDLQPKSLPALFHLVIPNDVFAAWTFMPKLTSAEPFFMGSAEMNHAMEKIDERTCQKSAEQRLETTYYQHKEFNIFKFAVQEIKPLCQAVHYIQPVFRKAPSLGIPENSDITTSCATTVANIRVALKRRFYEVVNS